jgi:hypothetical protein
MESLRAFYRGYYGDLVTYVPVPEDGFISLDSTPGLGVELRADVLDGPNVTRAMTSEIDETVVGFGTGDPWRTQTF